MLAGGSGSWTRAPARPPGMEETAQAKRTHGPDEEPGGRHRVLFNALWIAHAQLKQHLRAEFALGVTGLEPPQQPHDRSHFQCDPNDDCQFSHQ